MVNIKTTMTKCNEFTIEAHNALPHPVDLKGDREAAYNIPVDDNFIDGSRLKPIRASTQENRIGEVTVQDGDRQYTFPLVEMHITGIEDEDWVLSRLKAIKESDQSNNGHVVIVSRIAYAAMRAANLDPTVTPENRVGFAIPADIQREGSRILHATRLDQPATLENLPEWDQDQIDRRREDLTQPLTGRRLYNTLASDLQVAPDFLLPAGHVLSAHYDELSEIIAHTTQGIPIATPHLRYLHGRQIVGDMDIQVGHPDIPSAARVLGDAALMANNFLMPQQERDKTGHLTPIVKSFAVFSQPAQDLLAKYATTSQNAPEKSAL